MTGLARYEKLKSLLKDKIVSGKYQPGDRFFSQNELIERYNLSFSTVTRALDELVHEGYLIRHKGKGTFIKSVELDRVPDASPRTVFLFAPWNLNTGGMCNPGPLYKQLEALRPDDLHLKFVPHGSGLDDLEPFLFSRDPYDVAVFLYPLADHFEFIGKLAESMPVVVLSSSLVEISGHVVFTSFASASELATRHLLENGHTSIVLIGSNRDETLVSEFCEGYREALKAGSVPYRESLVSVPPGESAAYCNFSHVLARNSDRKITAVLAMDSVTALEVLSELRAMNVSVPDDCSLVFFDDLDKVSRFPQPLSAISFPPVQLAKALLAAIESEFSNSGPRVTPVVPHLELRSSTSACKSYGAP